MAIHGPRKIFKSVGQFVGQYLAVKCPWCSDRIVRGLWLGPYVQENGDKLSGTLYRCDCCGIESLLLITDYADGRRGERPLKWQKTPYYSNYFLREMRKA